MDGEVQHSALFANLCQIRVKTASGDLIDLCIRERGTKFADAAADPFGVAGTSEICDRAESAGLIV